MCRHRPAPPGFTLVETLVVIGIVGVLAALLLPAVFASREASRRGACQSKLHQLALAIDQFHAAQKRFPHGCLFGPHRTGSESSAWSWIAEVLPQLEQAELYRAAKIPRRIIRESGIFDQPLSFLRCPSDPFSRDKPFWSCGNLEGLPFALTNYQAVEGSNWGQDKSQNMEDIGSPWRHRGANGSFDGQDEGDGMMLRSGYRRPARQRDVQDGLAHTLMLGENLPEKNHWCCAWVYANNTHGTCAIPPNLDELDGAPISPGAWPNSAGFRSLHGGGLNFACGDGSVHFVANAIDLELYRSLATIAGGEQVTVP